MYHLLKYITLNDSSNLKRFCICLIVLGFLSLLIGIIPLLVNSDGNILGIYCLISFGCLNIIYGSILYCIRNYIYDNFIFKYIQQYALIEFIISCLLYYIITLLFLIFFSILVNTGIIIYIFLPFLTIALIYFIFLKYNSKNKKN